LGVFLPWQLPKLRSSAFKIARKEKKNRKKRPARQDGMGFSRVNLRLDQPPANLGAFLRKGKAYARKGKGDSFRKKEKKGNL